MHQVGLFVGSVEFWVGCGAWETGPSRVVMPGRLAPEGVGWWVWETRETREALGLEAGDQEKLWGSIRELGAGKGPRHLS